MTTIERPRLMYSGDEFCGDDETSGHFMGCEICGRYECPGECESPDEPDIDYEAEHDENVWRGIVRIDTLDELPY